jgi:hypothetical protein
MRRAVVVFLALAALSVGALLLVGAGRDTRLAFTLGLTPGSAVTTLAPGQLACQSAIDVPSGGGFDTIVIPLESGPGAQIEATVLDALTYRVLARGTPASESADAGGRRVARIHVTPAVGENTRVAVCLRNAGTGRVGVVGNADVAAPSSSLIKDGKPVGADAAFVFERAQRSVLSEFGVSADHAALFQAGWVGPWAFWLLAALVALGVPALLAFALTRAGPRDERG